MLKIRTTKTASNKTAVQVVERENKKTIVIKHIGSAKDKEELNNLIILAEQYIEENTGAISLFNEKNSYEQKLDKFIKDITINGFYYTFAYEVLSKIYQLNGFEVLKDNLLKDLAIIRIVEPTSKFKSIELLKEYFCVTHAKNTMYRNLLKFNKDKIEQVAINYAQKHLNFDFSLVFYDVTTLYFEAFEEDELRKCGFSKDNKSNQPQVVIGLVVNKDGYPISIGIFEGNKFEGHTIIPVILDLKKKHNIDQLTVVADAGMLSYKNMEELDQLGIKYIVGARLANLKEDRIKEISSGLNNQENIYYEVQTNYGKLVCDYSKKRASKNKSDRKKQLLRAEKQIKNGVIKKRAKFIQEINKSQFCLNEELVNKSIMLDGLKGYYTNLTGVDSKLIIARYKDLWHVEKSFRIAKSDLQARPIFHRKKEAIEAHILIVFVSLCMSKSIELLTGISIKKFKDLIWQIIDVELENPFTKNVFIKRTEVKNDLLQKCITKIYF